MPIGLHLAALAVATLAAPSVVWAGDLPKGFVYLAEVAPHVREDMRYAGTDNFTGTRVPGYQAADCILAEPAAQALSAVGDALASRGLGLMVFDCYRPAKAMRYFMTWAGNGKGFDPRHYPHVDRNALIAEGYIARKSGHSNGYTVDVTLTDATGKDLDMGTPFDFFDPLAHTDSKAIAKSAAANRRILLDAMTKGGFDNYSREWWHFSLRDRPLKAKSFDFDIVPRGR